MEPKFEKIKKKVKRFLSENKSEEEISDLLNILVGRTFRDKFSVKWYIRSIQLNSIASLGGKAVHKKHPDLNSRLVKIMHAKTKERIKNDHEFAEYMHKKAVERGNITHRKHPELAKERVKISHQRIKKYRKDPAYDKKYRLSRSAGGKVSGKIIGPKNVKIMREYLTKDILSKGGKKGGPIGGAKTAELFRQKRNILFQNVFYDSMMELECAKLFIKHKIVGNFIDSYNCHVKIETKDFDFFPQRKVFVEFHPLAIFDSDETHDSYYQKRRDVLDRTGYKNYPLIILTKLNEFEEKVLPYFKK